MKKIIRKLIAFLLVITLCLGLLFFGLGYKEYKEVTSNYSLQEKVSDLEAGRNYASFEEIPLIAKQAMVATEDKRFYKRDSVLDLRALGRASFRNIKAFKLLEGGSTIQQQVIKNLYFDHSASLTRKVSEWLLAKDLYKTYSKDKILEMYLNLAYFGDGFTGIKEASKGYFNKELSDMSDAQATLIVGITQSPSFYELSHNYENAKIKQRIVLDLMVEGAYLTQEKADALYLDDVFGG